MRKKVNCDEGQQNDGRCSAVPLLMAYIFYVKLETKTSAKTKDEDAIDVLKKHIVEKWTSGNMDKWRD